mmetsp:Transcript_64717/g.127041  ORF Transcript_64717/g.127041 Transcript_64717/m.127041 type:complete len:222 (+) Transcript_64717:278-943(+)
MVGMSVTTGKSNTVVWGGIHQKTSPSGGASQHGWPDPTYWGRLSAECANKGITAAAPKAAAAAAAASPPISSYSPPPPSSLYPPPVPTPKVSSSAPYAPARPSLLPSTRTVAEAWVSVQLSSCSACPRPPPPPTKLESVALLASPQLCCLTRASSPPSSPSSVSPHAASYPPTLEDAAVVWFDIGEVLTRATNIEGRGAACFFFLRFFTTNTRLPRSFSVI